MGNLSGFDATTVKPSVAFEAMPEGWYPAVITAGEFKPTKSGDGEYLEFKFEVIDGQYKGRAFFDRLNLKNKSDQTVVIAKAALSAICHAVGNLKPKDTSELHGQPLQVKLKCKKREDTGDMTNEVKGYRSMKEGAAASASAPAAGKAASDEKPSWMKKS